MYTVPLSILVSLYGLAHCLPSNGYEEISRKHLLPRAPQRRVYVIGKLVDLPSTTSQGVTEFPFHTFLFVEGTKDDGPLKIEVATNDNNDPYVRVKDFTPEGTSDRVPGIEGQDSRVEQGQTDLTNKHFLDPNTGQGIVKDALYDDPVYRIGPGNMNNLNTCQTLVARILNRLHIELAADSFKQFKAFDEHGVKMYGDVRQAMQVTQYVEGIDSNTNIVKGTWQTPPHLCQRHMRRAGICSNAPIRSNDQSPFKGSKNELAYHSRASKLPADVLDVTSGDNIPSKSLPAGVKEDKGAKVSLVRDGGAVTRFTTMGRDLVGGLGITATIVGAVFVILDFVDHNWVGGGIGAVGLVAGVAAGFALSGPIGWVVGGAITALFASKLFVHQDSSHADTESL